MPPEQWVDRSNVSPAVDVYNLGCVLCFLATGQYPFDGTTVTEILRAHLVAPPAKSKGVKELPRKLRALACRMLEKDPKRRPQSMTEVIASLDDTGLAT
jgi:serine/threonine protein kinase